MPHEELPTSAIDLEREALAPNAMLPEMTPERVVASFLPQSPEPASPELPSAEQVARQTDMTTHESTTDSFSPSKPANEFLQNSSRAAPNQSPHGATPTSLPQLAEPPSELSRSLTQQIDTTVRVQRELKIEIEDDVEQLAQRTGEYLATQLDQRDAQLLERIAQQINQHPTRQASFTGPSTSVGS